MRRHGLAAAASLAGSAVVALGAAVPAVAQSGTKSYQANLQPVPLNGAAKSGAGGTLMLTLNGSTATIHESVHGLASTFMGKPFPHVQHIHGLAQGTCPTASADSNHDGVISTGEGQGSYGPVQTTLSVSGDTSPAAGTNIKIAPSGSSYTYDRTIQLNSKTMQAIDQGNAVIVVHGLDPATAPKAATTEKSQLVPSLPLAATAPALCGPLLAAQVSAVPAGGAQTGAGGTSGIEDLGLIIGGGLALLAGGGLAIGRRLTH